jgi:hypothetical protein
VPHVEVGVSAGTVIMVLGLLLVLSSPGAIPFAYALGTRHQNRGGRRPALYTAGAYLLGCLCTLLFIATFMCSDFPGLWAVLVGYVPMWLFTVLILKRPADPETAGGAAHRAAPPEANQAV